MSRDDSTVGLYVKEMTVCLGPPLVSDQKRILYLFWVCFLADHQTCHDSSNQARTSPRRLLD